MLSSCQGSVKTELDRVGTYKKVFQGKLGIKQLTNTMFSYKISNYYGAIIIRLLMVFKIMLVRGRQKAEDRRQKTEDRGLPN